MQKFRQSTEFNFKWVHYGCRLELRSSGFSRDTAVDDYWFCCWRGELAVTWMLHEKGGVTRVYIYTYIYVYIQLHTCFDVCVYMYIYISCQTFGLTW